MKYYLVIENNEYVIVKVKQEQLESFHRENKRRLLLEANSLLQLLLLFESEIQHDSNLQLN